MTNLDAVLEAFYECDLILDPIPYDDDDEHPGAQYIDLPGGTRLYFDGNGKFIEAV